MQDHIIINAGSHPFHDHVLNAYDNIGGVWRLCLPSLGFLKVPVVAKIVVNGNKLPPQYGTRVTDLKFKFVYSLPTNNNSLHLISAGFRQAGHTVFLRYVSSLIYLYDTIQYNKQAERGRENM